MSKTKKQIDAQAASTQDAGNAAAMVRDGARLRVTPRARLTEVPELQATLKREIADGVRDLVFDLKHTGRIDSTGIGLLIAARNSLAAVQGGLRLVNAGDGMYKLLCGLRLVDLLHVSTDEGEARHG